jgi:transposase
MSRSEWARRVERWQRSGLRAADFARRDGCDAKQLTWWKWRLGREATTVPTFVPVTVVARGVPPDERHAGFAIEVALPSGIRLRVARGVDEVTLSRVVRALGASCS